MPQNRNPTQKKKSSSFFSESKIVHQQSKSSMKTALDVIKRIQWDENLPAEYFTIGYLDRFEGIHVAHIRSKIGLFRKKKSDSTTLSM